MKKITATVIQFATVPLFSLLGLFVLLVVGCATTAPQVQHDPTDMTPLRQFSAKSQLKDKTKDRVHSLDMDFLADGQERLRLDVSGTWSVAVAAAVVNGDQMTCLLPRQKRFYQGPANATALSAVMQIPLDPKLIYAILLDHPFVADGWTCRSENEVPVKCENTKLQQSVVWADRQGNRKKVVLDSPNFELVLSVSEVATKVQDETTAKDRAFALIVPTAYKPVRQ